MNRAILLCAFAIGATGCAPEPTRPIAPTAPSTMTVSPITIVAPTVTPTPCLPVENAPQVTGLAACAEHNAQGTLIASRYRNAAGVEIATFDPQDKTHNSQLTWHWERMSPPEKDQALRWILDPKQMRYVNFADRETWVQDALTKWLPRVDDFALPRESEIAIHWQADGPPMNQVTLFEGLSRVKSLALIRERRTCNYAHSHLGLIEYGGETILFAAPGWQTVSQATREIFTTVWTLKEAMVIYYAQFRGLPNACPSELEHLKIEYYSTIWLIHLEQVLARFVPADKKYWAETEIPFQIRNLKTQTFPQCLPPTILAATPLPSPTPCSTVP